MDNERRRILRMMAEGKISVEECEELLQALSNRRQEKTEKEVQAVSGGDRPVWPYILLVVLAIMVLPVSFVGFRIISFPGLRMVPCLGFPIAIALFILWVWMIVDCLSRLPCDFRLLFTTQHRYEKWIWLAIVILANWLGAAIYFFIIRQPAKQIAPPPPAQEKKPAQQEQPFTPKPRARSLKPLFIITIILALAFPVIGVLLRTLIGGSLAHMPRYIGALKLAIPGVVVISVCTIFWIWMLIDCLARDYREFGSLISSEKSLDKLLWILLILILPLIGAIAYHISVRRRGVEQRQ